MRIPAGKAYFDHGGFSDAVGTQNSDPRVEIDPEIDLAEQNSIGRVSTRHGFHVSPPERDVVGLEDGHLQRKRLFLMEFESNARPRTGSEAWDPPKAPESRPFPPVISSQPSVCSAPAYPSSFSLSFYGARFAFTRNRLIKIIKWSICPLIDARSRSRFKFSSSNVFSYAS